VGCPSGADEAFIFARVHRRSKVIDRAASVDVSPPEWFLRNVVTYMGETIKAEAAVHSAVGGKSATSCVISP
jgi:hypothetical protein